MTQVGRWVAPKADLENVEMLTGLSLSVGEVSFSSNVSDRSDIPLVSENGCSVGLRLIQLDPMFYWRLCV
jgi:hypothetical protein